MCTHCGLCSLLAMQEEPVTTALLYEHSDLLHSIVVLAVVSILWESTFIFLAAYVPQTYTVGDDTQPDVVLINAPVSTQSFADLKYPCA